MIAPVPASFFLILAVAIIYVEAVVIIYVEIVIKPLVWIWFQYFIYDKGFEHRSGHCFVFKGIGRQPACKITAKSGVPEYFFIDLIQIIIPAQYDSITPSTACILKTELERCLQPRNRRRGWDPSRAAQTSHRRVCLPKLLSPLASYLFVTVLLQLLSLKRPA